MPLTDRAQIFVLQFVGESNLNGTEAALVAHGLTNRASAATVATRYLKDPEVVAAIRTAMDQRAARLELKADDVLNELRKVVFFDPRRLVDEKDQPIALKNLDDDTAAAIAGLELEVINVGEMLTATVRKYKLANKVDAIDKAMRHLGLYKNLTVDLGNESLEALIGGSMPKKTEEK